MNKIICPESNKSYNIFSRKGKSILKKYIDHINKHETCSKCLYSSIINPNTGREVSIYKKTGKNIIKNYYLNMKGGSDSCVDKLLQIENEKYLFINYTDLNELYYKINNTLGQGSQGRVNRYIKTNNRKLNATNNRKLNATNNRKLNATNNRKLNTPDKIIIKTIDINNDNHLDNFISEIKISSHINDFLEGNNDYLKYFSKFFGWYKLNGSNLTGGALKLKLPLINTSQLSSTNVFISCRCCIIYNFTPGFDLKSSAFRDYVTQNINDIKKLNLFSIIENLIIILLCLDKMKLIHRDIKPSNLYYSTDNKTIKLIDYGLTETISNRRYESIGTTYYVAPEYFASASESTNKRQQKIREQKINKNKSDIYSMGITIYSLIFGFKNLAFNPYLQAIIGIKDSLEHQNTGPLFILYNKLTVDQQDDLKVLLSKMTDKDPNYRINLTDLSNELEKVFKKKKEN